MNSRQTILAQAFFAMTLVLCACDKGDGSASPSRNDLHTTVQEIDSSSGISNRIAIPSAVRTNLGISFVEVERRQIEQTLRVPGTFEYLPTARREYRTMLSGRVELLVQQFQAVDEGTPLYRINSPEWRAIQQQLVEAESAILRLSAKLETFDPLMEAHQRHEQSLLDSVAVWSERVAQLETVRDAGGGRAGEIVEARAMLTSARAELADVQERDAQLVAQRVEINADLDASRSRRHYLLDTAASIAGLDRTSLTEAHQSQPPLWMAIESIEVRAAQPGVVESMGQTNGSWADEKTTVMTVVRPQMLRFRASGLQSDLGVLRDGLDARIVPPVPTATGRSIPLQDTMVGTLVLGLQGAANDRTIDLYVVPKSLSVWARAGVSAHLEIVTNAKSGFELAIPLAAVQRDGIEPVVFLRARDNANEAIRLQADLGPNDGRWVAVRSGLQLGDEVVLDGAFQLMLGTSGSIQKGGHFHADGTFHEGED